MARANEGVWYRAGKDGWYVTVEGKAVSLKVRGEKNKAEAINAWHRLMASPKPLKAPPKVKEAIPEAKAGASASLTVGGLLDAFLSSLEAEPNTVRVYKHFVGIFTKKHGGKTAGAIRPHDAEAMATGRGWSDSTRHAFLSVLSSGFKWGERAGLIPSNPLAHIRRPALESRGKEAALTAEQHAKLIEAANPAFANLLRVLWATGCRPGEASRLTAQDVDFGTGVGVLAKHKARKKTGKPRIIVIPPEALALLRTLADAHPVGTLLRNSKGGAWNGHAIVRAMETTRKRAGVDAITYGYRHGFATDALSKGVPDATVAALLGHSGTTMLHRHYSHLTSRIAVLRDAASLIR